MKKKKRNFIIKICSILLLGIISVTLLGSWTYNPSTDTITSDNICSAYTNVTKTITKNGITCSMNNGVFTFNGTCTSQINEGINYFMEIPIETLTLESGTYYYTGFINQEKYNFIFEFPNYKFSWNTNLISNQVNISSTTNFYDLFHINIGVNSSFDNVVIKPMISTKVITSWEPYGQTYINKSQYDSLYEDWESVTVDYNTLVSEYDSLQADYNTLNTAYEQLEIRYDSAIDDLDQLRDEYADLQQQLADLNNELALLRPYIFNSSDIVVKIGNSTNTGDNFVATSVVSNVSSYFDNYGSFNLDSLYTNYSGFGSTYNAICFEVPNYNLMMYNVSFSFTGYPDMLYRLNYQDSVGNNLVVARDFTESYTDLYGFSIVSGLRNSSMWDSSQPIEYCTYSKIVFVGLNVGALNVKNLNFSSSSGYSEGFNQGYNSIKNTTDTIITRLNNQIDSLNSTIDNLHTQITDLQNQLNNSVGWRPLFFAMADTPLKVVSNVLGFELFGLNLFQAFIGIITALAIIWLIRKIWK